MSRFIINKSCNMCKRIELGLTEMTVGDKALHLCYDCMTTLAFDMIEFASMNLENEFEKKGYTISCDNNSGFIIKKKEG